jgi:hypothetical protein
LIAVTTPVDVPLRLIGPIVPGAISAILGEGGCYHGHRHCEESGDDYIRIHDALQIVGKRLASTKRTKVLATSARHLSKASITRQFDAALALAQWQRVTVPGRAAG